MMYWKLLTALLALHCTIPTLSASEGSLTKALQFGTTLGDYVKFSPDMSQVKDSLTVCSWVKKQLTGYLRSWFTYKTSTHIFEILISDDGGHNYIHNTGNYLASAVTVPLNTWTHQCQSWSTSTGTMKTYYNGTLIGSKSLSSAPLEEGGVITLGHDAGTPQDHDIFGGQLMKLDIFGKVLSSEEITELYNAGRCSDVEKKHQEIRFITWESILTQDKTGDVTEVDSGCPAEEEEEETEETKEETGDVCECPDKSHSIWDILLDENYLNQTMTAEKLNQIKEVWDILDHFVGSTITEGIIAHFKMFHPKARKECGSD